MSIIKEHTFYDNEAGDASSDRTMFVPTLDDTRIRVMRVVRVEGKQVVSTCDVPVLHLHAIVAEQIRAAHIKHLESLTPAEILGGASPV